MGFLKSGSIEIKTPADVRHAGRRFAWETEDIFWGAFLFWAACAWMGALVLRPAGTRNRTGSGDCGGGAGQAFPFCGETWYTVAGRIVEKPFCRVRQEGTEGAGRPLAIRPGGGL